MKLPLCQIDLAQTITEWKDVQSNNEDDQYLGDICFSLRYVPTSGKLTVGILECKRLKKMDITGASGMLKVTKIVLLVDFCVPNIEYCQQTNQKVLLINNGRNYIHALFWSSAPR